MKLYYVYILSNKKSGFFYVGFTDNIQRRMYEHKNRKFDGFTSKYKIDRLVYFEVQFSVEDAQLREKRLKKWNRKWKIELIESMNPKWDDLSKNFSKRLTEMEKLDLLFGKKN